MDELPVRALVDSEFPGEWGEASPRFGLLECRVLRATNLALSGLDYSTAAQRYVPEAKVNLKQLRRGDVILEAAGGGPGVPVGRVARFDPPDEEWTYVVSNFFRTLRPARNADSRFVYHTLHYLYRQPAIWQVQQQTTGIINLKVRDYLQLRVSVPPLEEQRRIAEILDTIDETIQATERVIAKLTQQVEGLEARLLREGQDAEHVALAEVASVDRGKFSARPRNDPSFYGGEYPFIQTGDVSRAQRRTGIGYAQTLNDLGLAVSRKFQAGTIAVTIAANIADTAILDRPMCFPDSVVGVTVSRPNSTRWIEMCIHAAKLILRARAPQSAQKNINLQDLRPLIIPVPDPARQHVFAELWEEHLKSVDRELLIVAKLNQLRSGLATDLLSGRVRTVAS